MGWSIGYDDNWQRDIGYGVPAYCDHPGCGEVIDRGLSYVCCDQEPYGGDKGCGLFFCSRHRGHKCNHKGFAATPDHPDWIKWKLTDKSWRQWRKENPEQVAAMKAASREGL
jgi:hypothetical protein